MVIITFLSKRKKYLLSGSKIKMARGARPVSAEFIAKYDDFDAGSIKSINSDPSKEMD